MDSEIDVLIIGGGVAGLTNALHLLQLGYKVTLLERSRYPKHKVCGEYISNEVLPYFMAMAIQSAKICAESISDFLVGKLESRRHFERDYTKKWNRNFGRRLQIGKILASVFKDSRITVPTLKVLSYFPAILPLIIKQTHGKPIQI